VLILFAELARFAAPLVETRSLEAALGANPIVDALRAPLGEGRVLAMSRRYRFDLSGLPIAYATPAGLESLRGFNSLVPRLPYRYLKTGAAGERLAWSPDTTIPAFEIRSRAHLDLFNVRSIVTDYPLDVDGLVLRREFDDVAVYAYQVPAALHRFERTYLYENTRALPRAYLVPTARRVPDLDAAIAAIGSVDPRREVLVEDVSIAGSTGAAYRAVPVEHRGDEIEMSVDAGPGGYLVLSEVFYPGWRAEVDGAAATIHRANGIFQVLRLGPGEHRVQFRYRPSAYAWGRAISTAGLVLAVALLLPVPRRRR
jgi:hypothetical protein